MLTPGVKVKRLRSAKPPGSRLGFVPPTLRRLVLFCRARVVAADPRRPPLTCSDYPPPMRWRISFRNESFARSGGWVGKSLRFMVRSAPKTLARYPRHANDCIATGGGTTKTLRRTEGIR